MGSPSRAPSPGCAFILAAMGTAVQPKASAEQPGGQLTFWGRTARRSPHPTRPLDAGGARKLYRTSTRVPEEMRSLG